MCINIPSDLKDVSKRFLSREDDCENLEEGKTLRHLKARFALCGLERGGGSAAATATAVHSSLNKLQHYSVFEHTNKKILGYIGGSHNRH